MRLPLAALILAVPVQAQGPQDTEVLFLGNSYTAYNSLPDLLINLSAAGGHPVFADKNTPGGNTLGAPQTQDTPHASNPLSLALIASRGWDFVVLQEQSCIPTIDSLKEQYMKPGATSLDAAIHANDPTTQTLFFQTWARKDGEQCCWGATCSPIFGDFDEAQDALSAAYGDVACELGAQVSPVGEAWRAALAADPTLELYDPDGSHPSVSGSYLAACAFYAVIFGESPAGLAYTGDLPAAEALLLQQVAADTVLGPTAWVLDCAGPAVYCTAKPSSAGCVSRIGTNEPDSDPQSGAGGYSVFCADVQGLKNGLLFAGLSGPAAIPFGGGTLCVQPPTKRGPVMNAGGTGPISCDGAFALVVNDGLVIPFGLDAGSGNTGWYQWWYRDPQNGSGQFGTALSDALELDFQ